jgi:hypothetical protein
MLFDIEADTVAGERPEVRLNYDDGRPTRAGWRMIRADAVRYLLDNAATLKAFRDRLTPLFDAMRRDKEPFKRRPNISLRLIAAGEPVAKLITLPHVRHDATGGYLIPSDHTVELLERMSVRVNGQDALLFRRKLGFRNAAGRGALEVGSLYRSAPDDARRIVGTIQEFLEDSCAVLARNCDQCCICGRGLTDELSRSRGIGPECIKHLNFVLPGGPPFALPEAVEA